MSPRKVRKDRRDRFLEELDPVLDGLHRAALRLTDDPDRAEDLLQEAILKAYRFFHTYREGTNFRAWMHRVLYTVFINMTRERRPRVAPLEGLPEPEHAESPLIEELDRPTHVQRSRALLEAVDDRIKDAVAELPRDLRMVFLLSTVEGLKYREIADVMGCPLGTVMSRLFRSRRMLQQKLQDYVMEEGLDIEPPPPAEEVRRGGSS